MNSVFALVTSHNTEGVATRLFESDLIIGLIHNVQRIAAAKVKGGAHVGHMKNLGGIFAAFCKVPAWWVLFFFGRRLSPPPPLLLGSRLLEFEAPHTCDPIACLSGVPLLASYHSNFRHNVP
jgi:hypothetical protein